MLKMLSVSGSLIPKPLSCVKGHKKTNQKICAVRGRNVSRHNAIVRGRNNIKRLSLCVVQNVNCKR